MQDQNPQQKLRDRGLRVLIARRDRLSLQNEARGGDWETEEEITMLSRTIEDLSPDPLTTGDRLDIAGAGTEDDFQREWDEHKETLENVYPERFGTMVAVMLDDSTLNIIRLALRELIFQVTDYLDNPPIFTGHDRWVDQLWTIDRACRAMGIE